MPPFDELRDQLASTLSLKDPRGLDRFAFGVTIPFWATETAHPRKALFKKTQPEGNR